MWVYFTVFNLFSTIYLIYNICYNTGKLCCFINSKHLISYTRALQKFLICVCSSYNQFTIIFDLLQKCYCWRRFVWEACIWKWELFHNICRIFHIIVWNGHACTFSMFMMTISKYYLYTLYCKFVCLFKIQEQLKR